jgi:hypothetical protein
VPDKSVDLQSLPTIYALPISAILDLPNNDFIDSTTCTTSRSSTLVAATVEIVREDHDSSAVVVTEGPRTID